MTLLDLPEIDEGLRDYQKLGKEKIYREWESCRTVMFQMPTGTGKTRLFSSIIKDTQRLAQAEREPQRVLVLAHRTELIEQIDETLSHKYGIAHGIIKSGYEEMMHYPVQVASVQTIVRRLSRWTEKEFAYVIIDEAHHAVSPTYLKICEAFPKAKILGVTATPCRLAGDALRKLFKSLVLSQPVSKFIEQGYLSPYNYYSIKSDSQIQQQLDNIKNFNIEGDYADADMMRICDTNKVRANIIKSYQKYANGKKGIIYTINQEHNKHICEEFAKIGVKIKAIDSKTPSEERKKTVSDFKHGKIDIICNVNIFSEGFDCPDCEFILLARPTCSLAMYLQQVGRGLRPHESKAHAVILDNVGSYNKFGLPSANRKWKMHFEGVGQRVAQSEAAASQNGCGRAKRKIKEGDEDMLLIFDGGSLAPSKQPAPVAAEAAPVAEAEKGSVVESIISDSEWFPFGALTMADKLGAKLAKALKFVDEYDDEDEWHSDVCTNLDMFCKDPATMRKIDRTFKFKHDGKYGVCELNVDQKNLAKEYQKCLSAKTDPGKLYSIILPPIYDEINIPDSQDRYICKKDGLYGMISHTKSQVLPFEFQSIEVKSDGRFVVEKNGKFGVMDGKELVLPISYESINQIYISLGECYYAVYADGFYTLKFYRSGKLVETESKVTIQHHLVDNVRLGVTAKGYAFICDEEGYVLFPFNFTKVGLLAVKDKWEILFSGGGTTAFLLDSHFDLVKKFEDMPIKDNEIVERYYLDSLFVTSGKNIKCIKERVVPVEVQEEVVPENETVEEQEEVTRYHIIQGADGLFGYAHGDKIILEPIFDKVTTHRDDRLIVTKDGLKGVYAVHEDQTEIVVPILFEKLEGDGNKLRYRIDQGKPYPENVLSAVKEKVGDYWVCRAIDEGEYIQYQGLFLGRYQEINHIGNGIYIVCDNNAKYGIIRFDGAHVILVRPLKYTNIEFEPAADRLMLHSENRRPRYIAFHTLLEAVAQEG